MGSSSKDTAMISTLLLWLFSLTGFSCLLSPDYSSCYWPNVNWNIKHSAKLVLNISSVDDCLYICKSYEYHEMFQTQYCKYFTWYDETHPYIPLSCVLYPSMEDVELEEDLYSSSTSGSTACFCPSPTACRATKDNLLYTYTKVETLAECERHCNDNHACNNFTWFTQDSLYSQLCILFRDCSSVDTSCSGCCSGTRTADSACSPVRHRELSSGERSITAGAGSNRDIYNNYHTKENRTPDWEGDGWYRFTGAAGTRMADKFPGWNKCSTDSPGYLNVCEDDKSCILPSVAEGKKDMTACFENKFGTTVCSDKRFIQVMNCGEFFLYYLVNTIDGSYCGTHD